MYWMDTFGAVIDQSTAVLCVASLIPTRNKYLYDLHVVVPGLAVCVYAFKCLVHTHDTLGIPSAVFQKFHPDI